MRIDCIASTAEVRIQRDSCDPKTLSGDNYSSETDELSDVSPQRAVTHTEECVTQRKSNTQKGSTHTLFIWKEGTHTLLSFVGQARDQYSIAKAELVTERKERKEENHTIFFTNNGADKAEQYTYLKKPRKVNS